MVLYCRKKSAEVLWDIADPIVVFEKIHEIYVFVINRAMQDKVWRIGGNSSKSTQAFDQKASCHSFLGQVANFSYYSLSL